MIICICECAPVKAVSPILANLFPTAPGATCGPPPLSFARAAFLCARVKGNLWKLLNELHRMRANDVLLSKEPAKEKPKKKKKSSDLSDRLEDIL